MVTKYKALLLKRWLRKHSQKNTRSVDGLSNYRANMLYRRIPYQTAKVPRLHWWRWYLLVAHHYFPAETAPLIIKRVKCTRIRSKL
jgi:hypothetical protein